MADLGKSRTVNLYITPGAFKTIFQKISGKGQQFDFSGIGDLRQLLSNERAKILHTIKNREPVSIYQLAKMVNRDFKSVSEDIKLLTKVGFVDMKKEFHGNRRRLRPIIEVDTLNVVLRF